MNKSSPTYILFFIIAICFVFGMGISTVHYATQNILTRNESLHRNRMICLAFGLAVGGPRAEDYERAIAAAITHDIIKVPGSERIFEVYEHPVPSGKHVGFIFSGMGFWDAIKGILVLTADLEAIAGIQFLEQKETPGLGARIEEKAFTDQFKNLSIDWRAPLERRIVIGPYSESRLKNRVDAITGATQTSLALMKFLNSELELFKKAYTRSNG